MGEAQGGRNAAASLVGWGGSLAEVLGPRRSLPTPPWVAAARREGHEGHEGRMRPSLAAAAQHRWPLHGVLQHVQHEGRQQAYEEARALLHAGAAARRRGPHTRGFPAAAAARATEAHARATALATGGWQGEGVWQDAGLSYEHLMALHAESNPPGYTARTVSADWVERTAALQPATVADVSAGAAGAEAAEAACAECSICIEPLFCSEVCSDEPGPKPEPEPVCKVLCGHHFHRRCISEWLKHDLRCPNCRFDLLHHKHT